MTDLRPADDESIPADERLHVRIFPARDSVIPVEGGQRPHAGSIRGRDPDKPMSVDLGSLCTPEQTRDRDTNGNFHVAMIIAGAVRQLGLRIVRDPIAAEAVPNPAHGLILGSRANSDGDLAGALTGGEYSRLARIARIILYAQQQEPEQGP
jgi:hypothetical protein